MSKRKPHPFALPTEKRKRLSKLQRARLFLERNGRCHRCRRKIKAGERWIAEHFISLECGGTNAWDNWDLTCGGCFHPKNREDRKKASKGRRLREANAKHAERMAAKLIPIDVRGGMDGGRPPERPAWPRGRPMAGSRSSAFKKKLSGRVERR